MKSSLKLGSIRAHLGGQFASLPDDTIILRKQMSNDIAIQPDDEMVFSVMASTPCVDRDGEIVVPEGIDHAEFDTNPVLLWAHAHGAPPVGKVVALQATPKGLLAKVQMAPTETGKELWTLIKGGFLRAVSIGFQAVDGFEAGTKGFAKLCADKGYSTAGAVRAFTKTNLLELSLCSLPANREALAIAVSSKSIVISDLLAKQLKVDDPAVPPAEAPATPPAAPTEAPVTPPAPEPPVIVVPPAPPVVPPVVAPVVPPTPPPEPKWQVIRLGELVLTDTDKAIVKSIAAGEVL